MKLAACLPQRQTCRMALESPTMGPAHQKRPKRRDLYLQGDDVSSPAWGDLLGNHQAQVSQERLTGLQSVLLLRNSLAPSLPWLWSDSG